MFVAALKYSWKFSFDDGLMYLSKIIDSDSNSVAPFFLTDVVLSK